ncbi:MAG TPA: hypothetical protein VIM02_01130 [Rhizomicrobium sp.]|jgi:CheY-like chemotaxis protein
MSFVAKASSAASTSHSPNRSLPEPAAPPIADQAPGSQSGPGLLSGIDILIAEDEVIVAMDIRDGLEDAGAGIVGPAYSLTQAMALAAHAKISAAVLDMRLGRESVGPVARVLAERGIPFVFYSGQINTDPLRVEWPAAPVISKPASTRQLIQTLATLLRR